MTLGDTFEQAIEHAVETAVRKALNVNPATNRRLLSVDEAATYLSLSKRELYNMLQRGALPVVKQGKRTMIDIRDLDTWIEHAKKKE